MRYEDSMKGVAAQIIKEQLRASKIKNNPEDFHWHDEYATLNFFRFICKISVTWEMEKLKNGHTLEKHRSESSGKPCEWCCLGI